MYIDSLVEMNIPAVPNSTALAEVAQTMSEKDLTSIPVIISDSDQLAGVLTASDIERMGISGGDLFSFTFGIPSTLLRTQHVFEAGRMFLANSEAEFIPVTDPAGRYQGCVVRDTVFESIASLLNIRERGATVFIRLEPQDYTLSDIVRIIESEDCKILGIAVERPSIDSEFYMVSVKIDSEDSFRVEASLRRHGYLVDVEVNSQMVETEMESRVSEFLNFLDL